MSGTAARSVALAVLLVLATIAGPAIAAGAPGTDAGATPGVTDTANDDRRGSTSDAGTTTQPETEVVRHELHLAEPGSVRVDLSVGLTEGTTEFEVTLPEGATVTATDGFEAAADGRTYAWDGRTDAPSLSYRAGVNRTVSGSQRFAATADWALLDVTDLDTSYRWRSLDDADYRRQFRAPDGHVGSAMAFLGEYETATSSAAGERFTIVVPEAAAPNASGAAFAETLAELSVALRVGARNDEVTAFVAPAPIGADGGGEGGLGGLATRSDLWVAAATATEPGPDGEPRVRRAIWAHEYLHTRQNYTLGSDLDWFTEASAYHYMAVLPRQAGELDEAAFSRRYRVTDEQAEAILSGSRRYDVWSSKGARVLAALDRRIRAETNGSRSLQDVLRRMNDHEGEVTSDDFRAMVARTAGASQDEWLDRHVDGTALPPRPDPDAYPARNVSLAPASAEYDRGGAWTTVEEGPLPAGIPLEVRHPTAGVVVRPGPDATAVNVSGGDPATVRLPDGEATLVVETFYGARSTSVTVETSDDVDGDGVTNAAELEQGSDPFDPDSSTPAGEGGGDGDADGNAGDGSDDDLPDTAVGTGPGFGAGLAVLAALLLGGLAGRRHES